MSMITQSYLKKLGINVPNNTRVIGYDQNTGGVDASGRLQRFALDYNYKNSKQLALDSAMQTAPNIGFNQASLTYFNPNVIPTLFAKDATANLLVNEVTGQFATVYNTFISSENIGSVQAYSDFTHAPTSDVNFIHNNREQYRFESSIVYGNLEVETAALAQINLVAQKQEALAQTMAKAHERINLYGIKDMALYGFLNCPDYASDLTALNVTINGGEKHKWDDKLDDKVGNANHIAADIIEMFNQLVARTQGILSSSDDFVLAVSPRDASKLTVVNAYGVSCMEILNKTLPHLTVEIIPQLDTKPNGEGRKVMLYSKSIAGLETGSFAYTEKLTMGTLVNEGKSFRQDCRAGTWGCIIKQPMAFSTMVVS